ncbi:hypothetical protein BN159_8438 [Streptomyces davaonensis JCM 4913]|uniref:Uncharacterized protein n=1 Tax=Streptomyces davaonensis (strain DSM 101723 / JCM 4913 / KCC S-0913 / 768) TaxID=1214101 RepID=K4R988_STRDJ|nr:hypothetical protein BN159_8438 [Streptomyces davaonensis JCM 4913]
MTRRAGSQGTGSAGMAAGMQEPLDTVSRRNRRPAQRYGVGGRCGERSMSRVISLGAKTRRGGPQKPVPRLV